MLLAAACGGGTPAPGATAGADGSAAPATGGSAAPATGLDPAVVDRLLAAGAEPGEAEILSLTRVDATSTGPRSAHYVLALPTNDVIEADVTVEPDVRGEPGITELTVTSATPERIDVHLVYFVDATGMPAEVRDALASTGLAGHLAGLVGPRLAEVDGVQVTVDWSIQKAVDELRDKAIEALSDKYLPGKTGTIMPVLKAGFAAKEGVELGAALDALLAELADLRACAENPTNPLTKRLYEQQPGERDRVLGEIDAVRTDLIANTMVMQLGVANELLAEAGPKWLGWVISPGTAWSKATLTDLNRDRLDTLKRSIPKCDDECAAGGSGGGSGGSSGGGSSGGGSTGGSSGGSSGGGACQFPVTISGTVRVTVRYDGTVAATGTASGVRWRYDPAASSSGTTSYVLEAGQYAWAFDWPYGEDSCGTGRLTGSGSDPLVPDERPEGGGEAGPGLPGENALFFIRWASDVEPASTYLGLATVRLHGQWTLTAGCGDVQTGDANRPPIISLNTWLSTTPSPPPVYAGNLTGTYSVTAGVTETTWEWDLSAGS